MFSSVSSLEGAPKQKHLGIWKVDPQGWIWKPVEFKFRGNIKQKNLVVEKGLLTKFSW